MKHSYNVAMGLETDEEEKELEKTYKDNSTKTKEIVDEKEEDKDYSSIDKNLLLKLQTLKVNFFLGVKGNFPLLSKFWLAKTVTKLKLIY